MNPLMIIEMLANVGQILEELKTLGVVGDAPIPSAHVLKLQAAMKPVNDGIEATWDTNHANSGG